MWSELLSPASNDFDFNSSQTEFKFELIIRSEENAEWQDIMDMDVHTRDSIVCGLITEYQGASKYLDDRWNPAQSTQTVICRVNSRKERLNLDILSQNVPPNLDSGDEATHVVVGVNYGAETYCVLVQDLEEGSDASNDARHRADEDLSQLASVMMKALKDRQDWTEFKEQFERMQGSRRINRPYCHLYSDFPTETLVECSVYKAYRHCLQLFMEMESNSQDCIPIAVYLCPLKLVGPQPVTPFKAESFRPSISDYVEDCLTLWNRFKRISAQAKAFRIESNLKIYNFSQLPLREFEKAVDGFQDLFRKSLKTAVVEARKSNYSSQWFQKVERVVDILQDHNLFSPVKLERQWLAFKMEELKIAKRMASVKEVVFMPNINQILEEIAKLSFVPKKYVLVLIVPCVSGWTSGYVYAMNGYLRSNQTLIMTCNDYDYYDNELPWFIRIDENRKVLAEIELLFSRVAENKDLAKQVQLYITFGNRGDPSRCRYSVYDEAGHLLKDDLDTFPGFPPWRFQ